MDKKLLILAIIFFLAFGINLSLIVFETPINRAIRASGDLTFSPQNSLIFAWPYSVKADGKTSAIISVFVKNENGTAIPETMVNLATNFGQLRSTSAQTDTTGKADFLISSSEEGVAEMEAIVNNIKLNKKISVKFRN